MSYYRLSIQDDTHKLFQECREMFIKTHPEFNGMFISENFIMRKLCENYMQKLQWKMPIRS